MGDEHPTPSSEPGEHAARISREMVRLMRRTAGRGPTQARTTIGRDHVLVIFRDALTEGERNLIAGGRDDERQQPRARHGGGAIHPRGRRGGRGGGRGGGLARASPWRPPRTVVRSASPTSREGLDG
jgi:hypothetical protein